MFYALEITIDWCRNVYSAYPITHNHIDTQKNRDSFFQSPSPKATDPFLTALPNTEPRFLSLVSTLLESVPTSFTQIRQRILPCSVRLLPPCYHPSLCSAKKELSNHQIISIMEQKPEATGGRTTIPVFLRDSWRFIKEETRKINK